MLATFADVPLPDAVVESLGSRWHTETLSIKLYPACAYLDSCLDAAVQLHGDIEVALRGGPHGDLTGDHGTAESVAGALGEIVVRCSLFTFGMDIRSRSYINGPASPTSALQFSVPYPVAVTLLTGAFTPADLASPRLDDPVVWDLAERVHVEHDPDLTRHAVLADGSAGRSAPPRPARVRRPG